MARKILSSLVPAAAFDQRPNDNRWPAVDSMFGDLYGYTNGAVFTPESYGAKGDGNTDDSAAFLAAMTAAAPVSGTVLLSAKTYAVNSGVLVPAGVSLVGNGYSYDETNDVILGGSWLKGNNTNPVVYTAPAAAYFSGTISGSVLTVTSAPNPSTPIVQGYALVGKGVTAGTTIGTQVDATHWNLSASSTVATAVQMVASYLNSNSSVTNLQAAANANTLDITIAGLGISGGTFGLVSGSYFTPGLFNSRIARVGIRNCSQWGSYLENFYQCVIEDLVVHTTATGAIGAAYFGASGRTGFNLGDSSLRRLEGKVTSFNTRGVVFRALGSARLCAINASDVRAIQSPPSSWTALTASTAYSGNNITLSAFSTGASIASFPVDMPVNFSNAGVSGLLGAGSNLQTFYVLSNDGTSVITIGNQPGGVPLSPTAALGTITTYGFPCFEAIAYPQANDPVYPNSGYDALLQSVSIVGIDAEGAATTENSIANARGHFQWTYNTSAASNGTDGQGSSHASNITLRNSNCTWSYMSSEHSVSVDLDYPSAAVSPCLGLVLGTTGGANATAPIVQRPPTGFFELPNGIPAVNFGGGNLAVPAGGITALLQIQNPPAYAAPFLYPQVCIGQRVKPVNFGGGYSLDAGYAGTVYFNNLSGAISWVLPSLDATLPGSGAASYAGICYELVNDTAYTVTVTTASGQYLQGGSKTTITIAAGGTAVVRSVSANFNGTITPRWAVLSLINATLS